MNLKSPDREIKVKKDMGRTEPSVVKPPPAFRRDARAKRARATINKVIPALLSTHPRARKGIERSELILDPPPFLEAEQGQGKEVAGRAGPKDEESSRSSRKQKRNSVKDDQPPRLTKDGDEKGVGRNAQKSAKRNSLGAANGPRITLCVADTLEAAHALLEPEPLLPRSSSSSSSTTTQRQKEGHDAASETATVAHEPPNPKAIKVGILNMASPLSPGGGFLNGATSQEESLCMRTTLLPALRDEFYRLPELGVVYTPDVLVFRSATSPTTHSSSSSRSAKVTDTDEGADNGGGNRKKEEDPEKEKDILPKNARYFIDVVTAAMLRLPDTTTSTTTTTTSQDGSDHHYANAADRDLAMRKMRAVLRVFASRGCTRIVLGAWGCGAYGNPVGEIARAWRRVLGVAGDRRVSNGGEGGKEKKNKSRCNEKGTKNKRKEPWGAVIEDIVFAINDIHLATAFARAFGEDIIPLPPATTTAGQLGLYNEEDVAEDPAQTARVAELREKIVLLEIQVEQARGEQLKAGLRSVLAGLRSQLPVEGDGGRHEVSNQCGDNDDGDDDELRSESDHENSSASEQDDDDDDDNDDDYNE